jgi:hypothetical protein
MNSSVGVSVSLNSLYESFSELRSGDSKPSQDSESLNFGTLKKTMVFFVAPCIDILWDLL